MTNKTIVQQASVDDYVAGHMSEQDIAEFETRFLDQPEIIEAIEISQTFKLGLHAMTRQATPRRQRPWWQRFFSLHGSSGWVTAFATMTFVVVAQSVYFSDRIEQLNTPQANTPVLILGQSRGGQPAGMLYLDDSIRWFALELELDWPAAERYSLSVNEGQSGQAIARVDDLKVSDNDTVLVSLPAKSFAQGEYQLAVSDGRAEVARFRLRIVRSGAGGQ